MIPLVDEMTEEVNVSVIFYLAYFNLWTYKGGGWEGLMRRMGGADATFRHP